MDLDLIQPLYIDEDGKHIYLCLDQVLVSDCTRPRVYVDDNVFEKAERVQEMYFEQDKRITGLGLAR
jgi:hypothetical protein